jgi:hypothetical protein
MGGGENARRGGDAERGGDEKQEKRVDRATESASARAERASDRVSD